MQATIATPVVSIIGLKISAALIHLIGMFTDPRARNIVFAGSQRRFIKPSFL
jgi:hypothetical protein